MMQFPKDFLWGAAGSAYQVEGDNANCDWWEWEKKTGLKEASGEACRHYQLYQEDFALARELNQNAHRLSVEWSRIQPEENKFSDEALRHYLDVINCLKGLGLEPVVTLHHFTNPLWFAKIGGWFNPQAPELFTRFSAKIAELLADKVKYWVTINEPLVYIYFSYILGTWPPGEQSFPKSRKVENNFIAAHIKTYRLIHDIYKKKNLSAPYVSLAHSMQAFMPCQNNFRNRLAVYLRDRIFNFKLLDKLAVRKALDFIGVNYYTRSLVEVRKWSFRNLLLDVCAKGHSQLKKNSIGWDIYPEGLLRLLLRLKRYRLPIFILENGICTADDGLRWEFIRQHLENLHLAMEKGVNVLGYTYWSLLDNFEWDKGFVPRFGLIEVDYSTYKRKVRDSARKLALVCKAGRL